MERLDPDLKFKWIDFGNQKNKITAEEEDKLRAYLIRNYPDLIKLFVENIENTEIGTCSNQLKIHGFTYYKGKPYHTDFFGSTSLEHMGTIADKSEKLQNLFKKIEDSDFEFLGYILGTDDSHIEQISKEYKNCNKQYFMVSLSLVHSYIDNPPEKRKGHANFLIIRKNDGTVIWIEPKFSFIDAEYNDSMIKSIHRICDKIGLKNPTIITPLEECPQTFTNDKNCMFWTFLIVVLLFMNKYEKSYTTVIKKFYKKVKKEDLPTYIDNFKFLLKTNLDDKIGGMVNRQKWATQYLVSRRRKLKKLSKKTLRKMK